MTVTVWIKYGLRHVILEYLVRIYYERDIFILTHFRI